MSHRRNVYRSAAQIVYRCATLGLLLSIFGCGAFSRVQTASTATSGDAIERVTEKGPIKVDVRFTPRELRLSDLGEMQITVTAEAGVEIKTPLFGQAVGDFVVRDYTERTDQQSSEEKAKTNTRRFQYKLEPMTAGRHLIRSMAIEFVDNRSNSEQKGQTSLIESEPFEVNVTSELGDRIPNLGDLAPMVPPRPLSSSSQGYWLIAGIFGVTIVALSVWFRRRRKSRLIEPPRQTAEEIAHAAFAALMAENLPALGQFKEFYLRLTGIVRNYIEATTGLRAPEQTTEEFLRAMRSRNVFSAERSERLKEFLEAADMVKYAGQQPEAYQIELSIARGREFVDLRSPVAVASTVSTEGVE